jgi:hypothetical protein
VIRPDADIEVVSRTPLSDLWAVNVGDRVELNLPGGAEPIAGDIVAIERDKAASVASTNVDAAKTPGIVRIRPAAAIDRSVVGSEVRIRLVRARSTLANLLTR